METTQDANEEEEEEEEEDKDDEAESVHLQPQLTCRYCISKRPHPVFVCLFAVSNEGTTALGRNVSSYICRTRNPEKRLLELNGKLPMPKPKFGMPYWVWICSVGPFFDGEAKEFKCQWQQNARKDTGRLVWAVMNTQGSNAKRLSVFVNDDYRDVLCQQLAKKPDGRSLLQI